MKVSITHAERRCAQVLAFDVVTPDCAPVGFSNASSRSADPFPDRLQPTQSFSFALPAGALLAFVAMAPYKEHGPAPLAIELEAEEGETLHADTVRVFVLGAPPAYYTEAALDEGKLLVRVAAPLALAGDRQQYGVASIEISPARDALLVAISNRELVVRAPAVLEESGQVSPPDPVAVAEILAAATPRPPGCICREYIGDALKIEDDCPVHRAPGAPT